MLRRILLWSTLLTVLPLAGGASAQVVTLEWSSQSDALEVAMTLSDTQVVKLNYGVSGAALRDVNLVIDLPPDVAPSQITKPLSFAGGCSVVEAGSSAPTWGSFRYRCTYATGAIDPAAGSVTGDITFNVLLRRQNFEHLQPLLFTATITGLNAADQPVQVPSERTFEATGVPTLSTGAASALTGFAAGDYDPDGPDGPLAPIQGLYEAAAFNVIGLGTTSIAPGTLARFTLGAGDYLVTYLVDPTLTVAGPEHFTAQIGMPGGAVAATANSRIFGSWNTVPANGNIPNWNNQVNGTSTGYFRALIFYPCDTFLGTPIRGRESNVRLDGFGEVWGADDLPVTRTVNYNFPSTITGRRCGQAQITKSAPSTTGIGRNYTWNLSVLPPLGVPISDDAYLVDALPADNRLRMIQRNSTLSVTSTEFDVHVCRLPDLSGQLIPREVFLAELRDVAGRRGLPHHTRRELLAHRRDGDRVRGRYPHRGLRADVGPRRAQPQQRLPRRPGPAHDREPVHDQHHLYADGRGRADAQDHQRRPPRRGRDHARRDARHHDGHDRKRAWPHLDVVGRGHHERVRSRQPHHDPLRPG